MILILGIIIVIALIVYRQLINLQTKKLLATPKGSSLQERAARLALQTRQQQIRGRNTPRGFRPISTSKKETSYTEDYYDSLQYFDDQNRQNNPYQNPGQDIIVDEQHHGVDHGMGFANSESTHHDSSNDFHSHNF